VRTLHSFLWKKFSEFRVTFCQIPQLTKQIAVYSTVDGQLKENQFCCSKYSIYFYLLVLMSQLMF